MIRNSPTRPISVSTSVPPLRARARNRWSCQPRTMAVLRGSTASPAEGVIVIVVMWGMLRTGHRRTPRDRRLAVRRGVLGRDFVWGRGVFCGDGPKPMGAKPDQQAADWGRIVTGNRRLGERFATGT